MAHFLTKSINIQTATREAVDAARRLRDTSSCVTWFAWVGHGGGLPAPKASWARAGARGGGLLLHAVVRAKNAGRALPPHAGAITLTHRPVQRGVATAR
eukprot:2253390-Pleurochrysis_carterae.AAC.3